MEENIKSQPKEEVKGEVKVETSKKPNTLLVVLITILVMTLLIVVLGLFFFKVNVKDGKEATDSPTEILEETEDDTESSDDTKTPTSTCQVESTGSGCEVKNSGWALFSLPDIKFSAEVPSDLITFDFNGTELTSRWVTAQFVNPEHKFDGFGSYIKTVNIRFTPFSYNEVVCGGPGCAGESYIDVDVFKSNKTLDQLWTAFKNSPTDPDGMGEITGSKANKWGLPVYKYTEGGVYGEMPGYLLVKDGFVYQISYYLSGSPKPAFTSGEKIMESMQFN